MAHDTYICYDEKDQKYCDEICSIFDENKISYWIKSRNMSSKDSVDEIINAIENSKCFIIILSKQSKDSNFIVTETDIAFSRDVPIILFNIDDSKMSGNLEFILETQKSINLFPDSKKQLGNLVKETSKIVEKPIFNVNIDSNSVKIFEKLNPKRKENKIKKYVKIAIPVVAVLILIYFFVVLPMGQHTTDDGVFSMNLTDVKVNGLEYTVFGESYNLPQDPENYFMNIQFFDKNDNKVYEVNSTADEFKSGVICRCNVHENNITHIGFKLTDLKGNVLSKDNYII